MKKPQYILFKVINAGLNFLVYTPFAKLVLFYWTVKFGEGFVMRGRMWVMNNGKFEIGSNVRIISGFQNNVGAFKKTSFWVGNNAEIIIGSNVGISNTTFVSLNSIVIGDDVFIGGGCDIYDTDFHPISHQERLGSASSGQSSPVVIGNKVFIGAHSIILKGVNIGDGAVVGAGSLVAKDIPPGEIWAGVPAKFVKTIA